MDITFCLDHNGIDNNNSSYVCTFISLLNASVLVAENFFNIFYKFFDNIFLWECIDIIMPNPAIKTMKADPP